LQSAFYAVERSDILHDRYRYGQNAVVELEFTCEYIFNKKAYDAVKPKEVKVQKEPMEQPAAQEPYRTDRGLEDLDSYPR